MLEFMMANFWIIFPAVLTAVAGLVLLTRGPKWNDYLAFGIILAGLSVGWFTLHPRQTPLLGDARAVQERVALAGKPVLLEFQSPFCIVCTEMKPIVDALEAELGDQIVIIRINIQESIGRELAPVYGIEFAPTFVLFDAQGVESWRQIGGLDTERIRAAVR